VQLYVYALWVLLKLCFDRCFLGWASYGKVVCHFVNMTINTRLDYVTMKFYILCRLIKTLIKSLRILILNMNALIFKFTITIVCLIFSTSYLFRK
jgi:hypothetical protein